jgi:hypothetical protein
MAEQEYKKGERIELIGGDYIFTKGGMTATVTDTSGSSVYGDWDRLDRHSHSVRKKDVKRIAKTLASLVEDDIVLADDEDEYKVLAILADGIYPLSKVNNFDAAGDILTAPELEADNCTIKDQPAEEVKMRVKELEEKLGLAAGSLHVVKE